MVASARRLDLDACDEVLSSMTELRCKKLFYRNCEPELSYSKIGKSEYMGVQGSKVKTDRTKPDQVNTKAGLV